VALLEGGDGRVVGEREGDLVLAPQETFLQKRVDVESVARAIREYVRNGGFVFGGFSLGERSLVGAVGADAARALYRLTLDAVATIRRRIGQYRIDCEMRDEGVYLANWFGDQRILDAQQRFMADRLGVEWQRIGRADCACGAGQVTAERCRRARLSALLHRRAAPPPPSRSATCTCSATRITQLWQTASRPAAARDARPM
jgi:hypothetical protein